MCLSISSARNVKRQVRKDRIVYKYYDIADGIKQKLQKNPKEVFEVTSPYQNKCCTLGNGCEIVSNRKSTVLREEEKFCARIHFGFHSFAKLKDAQQLVLRNQVIVEFLGKKEDQVAVGEFAGVQSCVHRKLTFRRVILN